MAFTNSSLVTYKRLTKNKTSPRNHEIDTITIHCAVGQATAKQGCDYFATTKRKASSNYYVGFDGSIGLSVEEKDRSWCSGGYKTVNGKKVPITVNGISGSDNDERAITIEVASDTKSPYAVTDAAYNALIDLVADICRRNNIKELKWHGDKSLVGQIEKQNMTVHRWFSDKSCPGKYLYDRYSDIAEKVNAKLKPKETDEKLLYHIQLSQTYYNQEDAENVFEKLKSLGLAPALTTSEIKPEKKEIKIGSTVKVKDGAKTYVGGNLAPYVYTREHLVKQINGDRIVITYKGTVIAAVKKSDLILIE